MNTDQHGCGKERGVCPQKVADVSRTGIEKHSAFPFLRPSAGKLPSCLFPPCLSVFIRVHSWFPSSWFQISAPLRLIFLAALIWVSFVGRAELQAAEPGNPVLLGTAIRTISPPPGVNLVGYPSPRPNTGVALDLCARAAVFGTPGEARPKAALVVLDVIHIDAELGHAIRERAAAALPGLSPAAIMVSATHTHSGPDLGGRYGEGAERGFDAAYVEKVVASAADAIAAAWASRGEVRARMGHASARLGHNRRVVDAEGKATNEWKDPDGLHSGIFNPDVPFVVFDDAQNGAVRAILVSYACHPVVLGPGNTKVSADYPGYLVRALESGTQARTAIFITGAAANINPRECLFADPERARPMGAKLAAAVVESLPRTHPLKMLPIAVVSVPLRVTVRPGEEKRFAPRIEESPAGPRIVSEVQVLRLGELALVSAPGELVAELGLAVQNSSPFSETMIVYNANDHLGYLITDAIRREGAHEADSAVSLDMEKPYLAAARAALALAAAKGE